MKKLFLTAILGLLVIPIGVFGNKKIQKERLMKSLSSTMKKMSVVTGVAALGVCFIPASKSNRLAQRAIGAAMTLLGLTSLTTGCLGTYLTDSIAHDLINYTEWLQQKKTEQRRLTAKVAQEL